MAIKSFKPYSASRRFMTVSTFEEITASKPEKSLLAKVTNKGGRNNSGRMTVRHQGGGHKRRYRLIDFKRIKDNIPAKVATIEYDPNRSANIALLFYADGEKKYIIAPNGLKVGDVVYSGPESDIKVGNALPLANIPLGTQVHNIEMKIGKGGQLVHTTTRHREKKESHLQARVVILRQRVHRLRVVHPSGKRRHQHVERDDHVLVHQGLVVRQRRGILRDHASASRTHPLNELLLRESVRAGMAELSEAGVGDVDGDLLDADQRHVKAVEELGVKKES